MQRNLFCKEKYKKKLVKRCRLDRRSMSIQATNPTKVPLTPKAIVDLCNIYFLLIFRYIFFRTSEFVLSIPLFRRKVLVPFLHGEGVNQGFSDV